MTITAKSACFLFVAIFGASYAIYAAEDALDIVNIHKSKTSRFSAEYSMEITETYIANTDNMENFGHFYRNAVQGKSPGDATPNDVNVWYDFLKQPMRTYTADFQYMKNGDYERILFHTPKGTAYPWEEIQELYIHKSKILRVMHPMKLVQLSDNLEAVNGYKQYYIGIDPFEYVFPFSFPEAKITVSEDWNDQIKWIKYKNKDGAGDTIFAEALVDKIKGYISHTSLLKSRRDHNTDKIFYSKNEDVKEYDGIWLPSKMTVYHFFQYKDFLPNEKSSEVMHVVESRYEWKLRDLHETDLPPFHRKVVYYLTNYAKDCDISLFEYPEVPESYSFQDDRYFDEETGHYDKDLHVGKGPHTFPK
ncbi:MAG: hypothetical protein AB1656_17460 [Candidatus Omnitrophota bacterium]